MKRAFVTGGTGFIGINLVEQLTGAGWQVTALHRRTSDVTYLRRFPVTLVVGSLEDISSLERGIAPDTDVVFHVAGDTNQWSRWNTQQQEANVTGTRNMVAAAAERGVKCFIHTSSIAAWGRMAGDIDEDTPQQGNTSWLNYDRTKWAGEQEAFTGRALGMKVVVFNPSEVIGPYDSHTWGRLFFAVRDDAVPVFPGGWASFTHVREVVKAHVAAVEHGIDGQHYILAGEDNSFAEYIQMVARLLGKSKPPRTAPAAVVRGIASAATLWARVTGREPSMTPELAALMTRKRTRFSSARAIRDLGYRIVPMATSVLDCYDWLKKEGLL